MYIRSTLSCSNVRRASLNLIGAIKLIIKGGYVSLRYAIILVLIGIMLPIILPSPRPFLIRIFGENNPLATLFICIAVIIIFFVLNQLFKVIIRTYHNLQKKHQN